MSPFTQPLCSAASAASTSQRSGPGGRTPSTAKSIRSADGYFNITFQMQNNTPTYARQTSLFGPDASMSLPAGSLASPSVLPGSGAVPKMNAICGPKCLELFGKFRPAGLWARTFAESLVGMTGWSSSRCALIWRLRGTRYSRLYFQLAVSALPTGATGSGLLPTAQTQGLKRCEKGRTAFYPVGLLPTPTANDGRNSTLPPSQAKRTSGITQAVMKSRIGSGSRLSPRFVAEMMGFPPDWTESPFLAGGPKASRPTEMP